ncbi:MAG: sigma-70 family RNA polymerase sigma factor [Planctomycetes bacterium]|nr:sigma-70 family RNA polymerase sigma factor [Planctomycetota bacterium]
MLDSQADPTPPDTPEYLLERHLDGDREAFEELVGRYEERLFAFIARMLGDPHLAEDIFQTVWLKVAMRAASFNARVSFSTWLFRIARNTALDELRRRRPPLLRTDLEAGRMADLQDRNQVLPLERMTRNELEARIASAIQVLPEAQRETFLLKEEAELNFEEIGVILGCGRETAKSRFRLAVEKLRLALASDGGQS